MASEFPFHIQTQPLGYQEKLAPDLINENQTWLCRGSQNMLIAPDGTVQSRKGMTVCGDAGDSNTAPIKWADTWATNTGVERPMRSRFNELQVLYNSIWRTFSTGYGSSVRFDGDTWFDKNELKDKYLLVNGSNTIFSWLGGVTEASSATTTTLTKKFVTPRNGGGNDFVFNAAAKTIAASWADFVALGFQAGDTITVAGGGSPNAGEYQVRTVAAHLLTLSSDETISNETNTGAVTPPVATSAGVNTGGNLTATTTYYYKISAIDAFGGESLPSNEISATTTSTKKTALMLWTSVPGAIAYKIYRTTTSGSYVDPTLVITIGSDHYEDDGNVNPLLTGVPAAVNTMGMIIGVKGKETWAAERFATTGNDLSFMLNGVKYSYTGGYNSQTLTGITPNLPAVTSGDLIFSPVLSTAPTRGDIPGIGAYDTILVSENQAWIGSSHSRRVYVSRNNDYTRYDYTTSVRINGEGGTVTLDSELRSLDVSDQGEIHATAGLNDVYKISLISTTSGSTPGEEIKVDKIKHSQGQAAVNQSAVTNTKNGLVYWTSQPSIDYLTRVAQIETQQGDAISDDIKDLVERLDSTDVDANLYLDMVIFILPAESMMILYDTQRKFWQPPQLAAVSCSSIIGNRLVVHSSVDSNSYYMFDGLSDNGKPIAFQAVYGYRNGGEKADYKTADKYYVELRMNQATTDVVAAVDLGYNGAVSSPSATISVNDGSPYVDPPTSFGGIGTGPFGSKPIGGFYASYDDDPVLGSLSKVRRVIALPTLGSEFFEMRFRVSCDAAGAHFQILAHGDNMIESESVLSNLIKED